MAIEINGDTGISGVNGSATTPAIQGTDTNTGLSFGTDEVNIVTGGSTRATVDSSGRLLVGTTTAQGNNRLQLEGSASGAAEWSGISLRRGVATASLTSGQYLGAVSFQSQGGAEGGVIRAACDANWSASSYPTRLTFETTASGSTSPTERMRINAAGFIDAHTGVGAAFGDVQHSFRAPNTNNNYIARFTHEATGSNVPWGVLINYRNTAPNTGAANFLICTDSVGTKARIKSNGGINNYQSNDSNLCDEREKKNIVDLDSTWNCLKNWELKKFHYNDDADDSDLRYGVIAQQVAPHCPEVIDEWVKQQAADAVLDEDGNEVEPAKEEITRLAVREQQMYWMAIKALQEAQTRIEQLETRVAQLEGGTN